MELVLNRNVYSSTATIGELFINGAKVADTLEDTYRKLPKECLRIKGTCSDKEKIYGKTCIPTGKYKVIYRYSPKFGKYYPTLLDVPHFSGILIHAGATVEHTDGCILVGELVDEREQLKNQFAISDIVNKLVKKAFNAGEEIWITINGYD